MKHKLALTVALLSVMGCHSNPYDGISGNLQSGPIQTKAADAPTIEGLPLMVVPDDNKEHDFTLIGHVSTGLPVITFSNLPSFVTYNSATGVLAVTPPTGSGVDPQNPQSTVRDYTFTVRVTSSDAPVAQVPQSFAIEVQAQAVAPAIVNLPQNIQIPEGSPFTGSFTVQSLEFPNGPFVISQAGLPPGLQVSPTRSPSVFNFTYTVPFTAVTLNNYNGQCYDQSRNGRLCLNGTFNITVVDPHGIPGTVTVPYALMDIRQNPVVTAPGSITGNISTGADFYVHAEDPNGELSPQVTASFQDPSMVGSLSVMTTASGGVGGPTPPYTMSEIRWTGVPKNYAGTSPVVNVNVCVYDINQALNQCVTNTVTVNF